MGAWEQGISVAKISALVVPIAGIALQVSLLVVLGVGGFRVASGAITIANLVADGSIAPGRGGGAHPVILPQR